MANVQSLGRSSGGNTLIFEIHELPCNSVESVEGNVHASSIHEVISMELRLVSDRRTETLTNADTGP